MHKLLLIALAGAFGTLCRYWVSGAAYSLFGRALPWGTWAVNIIGCFLFSLVWIMGEERGIISPQTRTIVLTGFMGAFTTFSTYIFESGGIIDDGQWLKLALNIGGQNVLGFIGLFLGTALGRIL